MNARILSGFSLLGICLGSSLAFSEVPEGGAGSKGGQAAKHINVTLDDLRSKCDAMLRNPQLIKPNVRVECSEQRYEWRQCPTSFSLTDTRQVTAAVGVKLWATQHPYVWKDNKAFNCASYSRHYISTRPVSENISCEDLLSNIKTPEDLTNRCATAIKTRMQKDPGLLAKDEATGESFNTCSGEFAQLTAGNPCNVSVQKQQAKQN